LQVAARLGTREGLEINGDDFPKESLERQQKEKKEKEKKKKKKDGGELQPYAAEQAVWRPVSIESGPRRQLLILCSAGLFHKDCRG
jgi:hypothetical protein